MTNTKISIIMPAKNAGKYIHECLSSIRRQTFPFWELIMVNDHSTDNTVEIVEEHISNDQRIRLLDNTGKGIIPALQTALSASEGEFITRMDADDVMPAKRLELMVETLQSSPPNTVVTGLVEYFSDQPISEGYKKYQDWLNTRIAEKDHWEWIYRECPIASPNWLIRHSELLNMGGFDQLDYPEDYHLVLNWYSLGLTVLGLNEVTLLWREHPERTSRTSALYDQGHFFKLKINHFVDHTLDDSRLVLWGVGIKGKLTAELLLAKGIDFTWMDLNPQKYPEKVLGQTIYHFKEIEKMQQVKLLIAVYPEGNQLRTLTDYLDELSSHIDVRYWFL